MPETQSRLPRTGALAEHVRAFGKTLTQLQRDQLPQRIEAIRANGLPSFHTFVNGHERDLAAVTASLTPPWSSEVAKGLPRLAEPAGERQRRFARHG
ncbi:hypothetical protein [Kitasatospora sp. NPDC059327]|uniref:hypothetical protein n=1 Tax=Kitasatospora sp. NPDC059327 TaxID=3346803 RepID=UPI0036C483D5